MAGASLLACGMESSSRLGEDMITFVRRCSALWDANHYTDTSHSCGLNASVALQFNIAKLILSVHDVYAALDLLCSATQLARYLHSSRTVLLPKIDATRFQDFPSTHQTTGNRVIRSSNNQTRQPTTL